MSAWAIFLLAQRLLGFRILSSTGQPPSPPGQQRCPAGDQGQLGELCENLNWCDIAGNCNRACCRTQADCAQAGHPEQKCNLANGYCRSGKSCNPNP